MFRPLLSDWRSMLAFAGVNSAIAIMNRLYEVLPYLVLGRVLSADSVGLYNRAVMVCQLPDKFVLLGLGPVALPVFAAEARAGHDLAAPYLRAAAYISAVQWPALVLTALLAHPLVMLLLGPQWLASVPLVRILTLAATAFFLAPLTYPVLVAVGAIRHVLASCLLSLPVSAAILIAAAHFGLEVMAWSALLTTPFQTGVALYFVRRHLRFGWKDFGRMVAKSLGVTILTVIAPVTVILAGDAGLAVPLGRAAVAGLGAAACWAAALFLLRHPFAEEVRHLASALHRRRRTLSETRSMRRLGNRPKPS
jgi:O-antigen/teichoic acid export membrane protein